MFKGVKKHLSYNTYNTSQQCIYKQSPISSVEQTKYISLLK